MSEKEKTVLFFDLNISEVDGVSGGFISMPDLSGLGDLGGGLIQSQDLASLSKMLSGFLSMFSDIGLNSSTVNSILADMNNS
jgi:hypothetical protein